MFIETSKDLLFIVLAFCILWLSIFLSWLLYYLIAIVRDAESLVRQVRHAVDKIDELAHAAHEKMERSAASFTLIAQALKEVVSWAIKEKMLKGKKGKKTGS
jgi:hypothetical protein